MYPDEQPDRLKPDAIAKLADCPASNGPGSNLPRAALDRWKAVQVALEAVLTRDEDIDKAVEDNTKWLDQVQTDLVRHLVTNGVAVLGAEDADIDFAPEDNVSMVQHPRLNAYFDSYFQVEVADPNNPANRERLKIRTGAQGTGRAEAAVLLEGGDPAASYADLMLSTGAIEPIEVDPEDRSVLIATLSELAETRGTDRDRIPGLHCYQCSRIARCGQFPPPSGYRVGANERTIRLSKTDMLRLGECHRRSAWKALHTIPKEDADDGNDASAVGLLFHDFIATALMADDPAAEFQKRVGEVSSEDAAKLRWLYERHEQIEAQHVGVTPGRVEYEIGVTVPLRGPVANSNGVVTDDRPVSVVVIARADAVGREADNTPAVIEHRTGKNSDRIDERETALYAVSAARLLKVGTIAVHQHALGASGDPKCERIVYDAEGLAEAEALLERTLKTVVGWHPLDATQPAFTVGEWCAVCPYEARCKRYR